MKLLPGFRDFYPADCARRNYITSTWRRVAARYGFQEVDGPMLEPMELYQKKSGGELVGQLFDFQDKGGRHVAMRPEMTPTLARMIAAREREFRKPIKWFSIASFFRYEKQQRGRLREFLQLNCDLIGDASPAADAELLALLIDLLREFGLSSSDFVLRLSDRQAWVDFLHTKGRDASDITAFLAIMDKWEREPADVLDSKLAAFQCTIEEVQHFIAHPLESSSRLAVLVEDLNQRGLGDFITVDLTIVRGLAYYNGVVFEIFDREKKLRALAGGGRYDQLIQLMSDGATDLPAVGFGMGDVVLGELLSISPTAEMHSVLTEADALDIFIIIADEAQRPHALRLAQTLRSAGLSVEFSLHPAKVGKQFQMAESRKTKVSAVVGAEFPALKVKNMSSRTEMECSYDEILTTIQDMLAN